MRYPHPVTAAMLTRRTLCLSAATLAATRLLRSQTIPTESTRPDLAAIDRDHILATADHALTLKPSASLTTGAIPALTAATILLRATDPLRAAACATAAAAHLRALFVTPATQLNNELADTNNPEDLVPLAPLAEIAVTLPFLTYQATLQPDLLSPTDLSAIKAWFAELLHQLNTARTAGLAKDRKDHVGGVWLLLAAACAHSLADDLALVALRHHLRSVTLRAQILADGTFPHELSTKSPYRNSLFALDLLAGATELLSTKFDSLWDFQLQDGPGLRVAIAKHAPWIANRGSWPYLSDAPLFHDLPCRRPALLLAGRAYAHPDYITIWRSLTPPEPTNPTLLAAFPIRQSLLWFTRPHP